MNNFRLRLILSHISVLCPFPETGKSFADLNNSMKPPSLFCLVFCQLDKDIDIWDERSSTEKNKRCSHQIGGSTAGIVEDFLD